MSGQKPVAGGDNADKLPCLNLKVLSNMAEIKKGTLENEKIIYENYIERLKTFILCYSDPTSDRKWLRKPYEISPPICAKYGWVCVGLDLIECSSCKRVINGKLPQIWELNVYKECVAQIAKKIQKDGHCSTCDWLSFKTPERFTVMELGYISKELEDFKKRLTTLFHPMESIPSIDGSVELQMKWDNEYYVKIAQFINLELTKRLKSAIILAVTGWSREDDNVCCHCCLRTLGLSYYAEINPEQETTDAKENLNINDKDKMADSPPKKRVKILPKFDPLYEHRDWCLWITPTLPNQAILGWKKYLDFIINNVSKSRDADDPIPEEEIHHRTSQLQHFFENLENPSSAKEPGEE